MFIQTSYSYRDSSLEIIIGKPHRHSRNAANGSQARTKSHPCYSVEPRRNDEVKRLKRSDSNATQKSLEKVSDRDVPTHLSPTNGGDLYWVCCGALGTSGTCHKRGTWLLALHDTCLDCSHPKCPKCRHIIYAVSE